MVNLTLRPLERRLKDLEVELEEAKKSLSEDTDTYDRLLKKVEDYRYVIKDQELNGIKFTFVTSEVLHNEMETIIESEGKPLHRKTIYERLLAIGIQVKGQDPIANTGAHLSSDKRFLSCGEGMWRLNNV